MIYVVIFCIIFPLIGILLTSNSHWTTRPDRFPRNKIGSNTAIVRDTFHYHHGQELHIRTLNEYLVDGPVVKCYWDSVKGDVVDDISLLSKPPTYKEYLI